MFHDQRRTFRPAVARRTVNDACVPLFPSAEACPATTRSMI